MRSIAREGDPGLHREHRYFIYMLASGRNGTLYTGVTNNLVRRIAEHRDGRMRGFTRRYGVTILVWYGEFGDVQDAIAREKQVKGWNRAWKIRLIEKTNPVWNDLMTGLV
jgi:putative endonuclease